MRHKSNIRNELMDSVKIFVELAKSQGSRNANWYYKAILDLVKEKAGIPKGIKVKDADLMIYPNFQRVCYAMKNAIMQLNNTKMYYKTIYKKIKDLHVDSSKYSEASRNISYVYVLGDREKGPQQLLALPVSRQYHEKALHAR